jgi:hypothetical protein
MLYRNNIRAGLLPSFDPECTSEHGIASINVPHLSRNETRARAIARIMLDIGRLEYAAQFGRHLH